MIPAKEARAMYIRVREDKVKSCLDDISLMIKSCATTKQSIDLLRIPSFEQLRPDEKKSVDNILMANGYTTNFIPGVDHPSFCTDDQYLVSWE